MSFKKTLLAIMMLGATAAQADYRAEIGASLLSSRTEVDDDDNSLDRDIDATTFGIFGAFYFQPVATASGPLGEAVFLSKASGMGVGISNSDVEYDWDEYGDEDYDSDRKEIMGHFVFPGPSLILDLSYATIEDEDIDSDYYSIGFGGYITDRITLMVEYSKEELDDASFDDDSIDRLKVTYRQLIQLGATQNLALEPYLEVVDYYGEDGASVGINAVWYITRALGLKAGLAGFAADSDEGDVSSADSSIGIEYFVTENIQIGGAIHSSASEFDSDDSYISDVETEGAGIEANASVRF